MVLKLRSLVQQQVEQFTFLGIFKNILDNIYMECSLSVISIDVTPLPAPMSFAHHQNYLTSKHLFICNLSLTLSPASQFYHEVQN